MKLGTPGRFRYDAFISYSHRNKDWVRGWLVPRLKAAGVRVCIDRETFAPGGPKVSACGRRVGGLRRKRRGSNPPYILLSGGECPIETIMQIVTALAAGALAATPAVAWQQA